MAAEENVVHLVNPMWDVGGSERRAIELYRTLSRYGRVQLWSEFTVAPALAGEAPILRIVGEDFPRGGVLVVIGVYFDLGRWLGRARPRRVILVVNTPNAWQTQTRSLRLLGDTGCAPEIIYSSEELATKIGLPGTAELSMIDLARFSPAAERPRRERFTVGRMSRDATFKHHAEDPLLYTRLVELGVDVRIQGGTVLQGKCPAAVTLLPGGAMDPGEFLRSLDCFYYRTAPEWYETFGRVVFEAMACGLPVVCEKRHGYRDLLRHGEDAFLFDTMDEAFALLERLRTEPGLRERVGIEARRTIERLYDGHERQLGINYFR